LRIPNLFVNNLVANRGGGVHRWDTGPHSDEHPRLNHHKE